MHSLEADARRVGGRETTGDWQRSVSDCSQTYTYTRSHARAPTPTHMYTRGGGMS